MDRSRLLKLAFSMLAPFFCMAPAPVGPNNPFYTGPSAYYYRPTPINNPNGTGPTRAFFVPIYVPVGAPLSSYMFGNGSAQVVSQQAPAISAVPGVSQQLAAQQPPLQQQAGLQGGLAGQAGIAAAKPANPLDQAIQQLSSPNDRDRIDAAMALGRNKVDRAVDPLCRMLANDMNARAREAAARALGLIAAPASLNPLRTAADGDADRDVRAAATFSAELIRITQMGGRR